MAAKEWVPPTPMEAMVAGSYGEPRWPIPEAEMGRSGWTWLGREGSADLWYLDTGVSDGMIFVIREKGSYHAHPLRGVLEAMPAVARLLMIERLKR